MGRWNRVLVVALWLGTSVAHAAGAPPHAPGAPPDATPDTRVDPTPEEMDDGADFEPPRSSGMKVELGRPVKFGFGLEGYAGIAAQARSGEDRAHGLAGGLARFRFHYFELGGTFELTDSGQSNDFRENRVERWRALGGFVGAVVPFHHWVDVEAAVGVSSRNYANGDSIYGPRGFSTNLPALTFRFGVSDRFTHRLIGPRIGAALVVAADLAHAEPRWSRQVLEFGGGISTVTGTTPIGGVSIGLVVSAGLELGARPFR
ncbi:MAG TPA: hypothetical protein VH062_07140 [Polyangiaceae bacterium]|jgi:hypothetical protein|nr:hypothetical protein [Polyangiaceae bacterium]